MQRLVFYIVYPLIWLLSILPFPILYLISDLFFFIAFYIVGYRKELVLNNLRKAFPDKTEKEIRSIRRKFYQHFVDLLMEMIKSFTLTEKQIRKRYIFKNLACIEELIKKGKSVIAIGSHYANWEWLIGVNLHTTIPAFATYTHLSNTFLGKKIKKTRERFGIHMILTKNTLQNIENRYNQNEIGFYGLLSDQSPEVGKAYYWSDFLGVRVPIHTGAEMLAKKYDYNFVNIEVTKVKRGYYEVEFELITESPRDFKDYQLTDIFLKKLEKQIRKKPEYYFWTHNRFKHEGKEPKKQE